VNHYAVVPVKGRSERVESKNFRPFADGMSLTELKVRQLTESGVFADVFISSDADEAAAIAEKYGVTFIRRDEAFCNNVVPWSDVVYHVVKSLPISEDETVCWSQVTSPLFSRFREAIEAYERRREEGYNGLLGVSALSEYIVTEKVRPVNYAWGVWHPYTQDIERLYRVTGSVHIASRGEMMRCRYIVPQKPFMFETSPYEAIDVDTDYDFRLAQLLHQHGDEFAALEKGGQAR
jgi:N-acylneuraminate cytidylyltransferase